MGLNAKRAAVTALAADLAVIPECARASRLRDEPGVSSHWRGSNDAKGLGVFGFNGWTVEPLDESDLLPWTTPVTVIDPAGLQRFTLVAVWTGTPGKRHGRPGYAAQVAAVVERWDPELARGVVVLAGDFNCSTEGPAVTAHGVNVKRLEMLGVHSAYHAYRGLAHGEETEMTLRWIAKGRVPLRYHCDFIFMPTRLIERVRHFEIGHSSDWIEAGLSDHAPVIVEIG